MTYLFAFGTVAPVGDRSCAALRVLSSEASVNGMMRLGCGLIEPLGSAGSPLFTTPIAPPAKLVSGGEGV